MLLVAFGKKTILDTIESETGKRMVDNNGDPLVMDEKETAKVTRKGMLCGGFKVLHEWATRPKLKEAIEEANSTPLG